MPKKKGKRAIESVHQRTQREFREARMRLRPTVEQSKKVIPSENDEAAIRRPVEFTFNWGDESSSPLVPNLVKDGEINPLRKAFINSVARGETNPDLDCEALNDPKQFAEDTLEGIHRWHTYGKER